MPHNSKRQAAPMFLWVVHLDLGAWRLQLGLPWNWRSLDRGALRGGGEGVENWDSFCFHTGNQTCSDYLIFRTFHESRRIRHKLCKRPRCLGTSPISTSFWRQVGLSSSSSWYLFGRRATRGRWRGDDAVPFGRYPQVLQWYCMNLLWWCRCTARTGTTLGGCSWSHCWQSLTPPEVVWTFLVSVGLPCSCDSCAMLRRSCTKFLPGCGVANIPFPFIEPLPDETHNGPRRQRNARKGVLDCGIHCKQNKIYSMA